MMIPPITTCSENLLKKSISPTADHVCDVSHFSPQENPLTTALPPDPDDRKDTFVHLKKDRIQNSDPQESLPQYLQAFTIFMESSLRHVFELAGEALSNETPRLTRDIGKDVSQEEAKK